MQIFSKQKNIGLPINKQAGFSLVEVLIASLIISASIFALVSASTQGIQLSREALQQTQASFILEEGAEAVKSIRDAAWTNISGLTLGSDYYIAYNTGTNTWGLTATNPGSIDSLFTRTIQFGAVSRDGNDDIASSGTTDVRTKKVTITVTWPRSDQTTSTRDLSFYISDIFN
ncbi:MAG: prepilin-type N-terminal cleavage/methylation domain-containing protein [Patescibacteria group bacterium]